MTKHLETIYVFLLLLILFPALTAFPSGLEEKYIMTANSVSVPVGRYVILKKDNKFGVVKFIEAKENSAIYEWYCGINQNGFFSRENSQFGKNKLKNWFIPIWSGGIQLGNVEIKCGEIKVLWSSYTGICVDRKNEERWEVVVSPTGWTEIEKVNIFDKRLKWYKFDPDRKEEMIPLADLPH